MITANRIFTSQSIAKRIIFKSPTMFFKISLLKVMRINRLPKNDEARFFWYESFISLALHLLLCDPSSAYICTPFPCASAGSTPTFFSILYMHACDTRSQNSGRRHAGRSLRKDLEPQKLTNLVF